MSILKQTRALERQALREAIRDTERGVRELERECERPSPFSAFDPRAELYAAKVRLGELRLALSTLGG